MNCCSSALTRLCRRLVATLALDDPGVPVRPVFSPSVATTLPLNELIAVARAARHQLIDGGAR